MGLFHVSLGERKILFCVRFWPLSRFGMAQTNEVERRYEGTILPLHHNNSSHCSFSLPINIMTQSRPRCLTVVLTFLVVFWSTDAQNNTTTTTPPPLVRYYAMARPDQSGRQVLRFLVLDALATKAGGVMQGLCPLVGQELAHTNLEQTQALLRNLGLLDTVFRFECPNKDDMEAGRAVKVHAKDCRAGFYLLQTETAWLENMRKRVHQAMENNRQRQQQQTEGPRPNNNNNDKKRKVAIHLRRGDITPCSPKGRVRNRYLPNMFYLKLIDMYLPSYCGGGSSHNNNATDITQHCHVTIYSESESAEPFTPFIERGFDLQLDGDIANVWRDFYDADVLISSESAFSYIPAVLKYNQDAVVIFPEPFDIADEGMIDLPGWLVIPAQSQLRRMAQLETEQLIKAQCGEV